MEMVLIPVNDLRTMLIETNSIALKHNLPVQINQPEATEPISPEETCKRLDISKATLWAWEKKEIVKGYHLGNRKYFIWQEVITAMTKKGGQPA